MITFYRKKNANMLVAVFLLDSNYGCDHKTAEFIIAFVE